MAVATTFEDETIAMPKPRQWMLEEPMSSIVLAVLELEQNKKASELGRCWSFVQRTGWRSVQAVQGVPPQRESARQTRL